MAITLRPLTSDNLPECLNLRVSDEQRYNAVIEETPEMIEYVLNLPSFELFTIYNDETMVGLLAYSCIDESTDYQIHRLIIDEKHQRHGYGESAMRLVIEKLSNNADCERIVINYMSFNESAVSLYEKLGFMETSQFQKSEGYEDEPVSKYAFLQRASDGTITPSMSREAMVSEYERMEHKLARMEYQLGISH